MRRLFVARAFALVAVAALAACGAPSPSGSQRGESGKIPVVTTFSTLNSFVEGVGGNFVTVRNLVPVGASPEEYQPTPQDIATLSGARVLVENGAGLEAWLQRTLADANDPRLQTVVLTDGLPVKVGNPHLWMDPVYAKAYVDKIRIALDRADPAHAVDFDANAKAYDAKLDALTAWIRGRIATIPPKDRLMIVFHNAWQYYNDRFGIVTVGAIETAPGQDPNPAQIARLVDRAKALHVRAIFGEPEYSPKLVQSLAHSANVDVVDDLYDDSIGQDPRVRDYISMLRYDTNVIVKALS